MYQLKSIVLFYGHVIRFLTNTYPDKGSIKSLLYCLKFQSSFVKEEIFLFYGTS